MKDIEEGLNAIRAARPELHLQASRELVQSTIGEAVLALLNSGRGCDRDALLAWLDEAITARPKEDLKRQMYEAARKTLPALPLSPSS